MAWTEDLVAEIVELARRGNNWNTIRKDLVRKGFKRKIVEDSIHMVRKGWGLEHPLDVADLKVARSRSAAKIPTLYNTVVEMDVGDLVRWIGVKGSATDFVGRVTAVHPGIGFIDVEFPTGNFRVEPVWLAKINPFSGFQPVSYGDSSYTSWDKANQPRMLEVRASKDADPSEVARIYVGRKLKPAMERVASLFNRGFGPVACYQRIPAGEFSDPTVRLAIRLVYGEDEVPIEYHTPKDKPWKKAPPGTSIKDAKGELDEAADHVARLIHANYSRLETLNGELSKIKGQIDSARDKIGEQSEQLASLVSGGEENLRNGFEPFAAQVSGLDGKVRMVLAAAEAEVTTKSPSSKERENAAVQAMRALAEEIRETVPDLEQRFEAKFKAALDGLKETEKVLRVTVGLVKSSREAGPTDWLKDLYGKARTWVTDKIKGVTDFFSDASSDLVMLNSMADQAMEALGVAGGGPAPAA